MTAGNDTNIFKDVKYYIIGNIDDKVEQLLIDGGGRRDHYLSEAINYVIADDPSDSDCSEAKELFELPVVTSRWVILSVKCGVLLPTNAFQPDIEQIFSGVVACPSKVSRVDNKLLWSLVTSNGGEYQMEFTHNVTHLITAHKTGPKYDLAMQHSDKVVIVTPDWVSDCVIHKEHLDTGVYHPRLICTSPVELTESPSTPPEIESIDENKDSPKVGKTKEALARMVSSRIMAGWKAPELEPLPPAPPIMPLTSPMRGMFSPRRLLRNITNNGLPLRGRGSRGPRSPRSPRGRGLRGTPRISQLVHNGLPGMMLTPPTMLPRGFLPTPPFPHGILPAVPAAPVYFGHDPGECIPQDMFLFGCVFYIIDYQKFYTTEQIQIWKKLIENYCGEVEETYNNRVTHLICEHQQSDMFQLARRDNKRLVTAFWLDDMLHQKKMSPPSHALHVPHIYGSEKPLNKYVICVTNFEGRERHRLKMMLELMGAKYTGFMTRANSVLICRKADGLKYSKAIEWQIPVVNVHWLQDIYLGDLSPLKLPVQPKYQNFSMADPFSLDLHMLAGLMDGWKTPVKVKEAWKKFKPSQLLKPDLKRPADEQLESNAKKTKI